MELTTQARRRPQPAPLAEALNSLMAKGQAGLTQRYETASQIRSLWVQMLPPELAQHCRIADVSGGVLSVEADSPSYMYELRLSSQQLVGHLRSGCPAAKIRTIKITLSR